MPNEKMYEVGQWRGMKKYSCKLCVFDTLDETEMLQHIKEFHTEKPKKQTVKVPVYDRFGNLIKKREV